MEQSSHAPTVHASEVHASEAHASEVHAPEVHKPHTSPWVVFAVLAALTLIEVGVSFIPGWVKNPLLMAISLSKAALVALYYMHLRYDKPIYSIIFVAPALFGLLLAVILLGDT